MKFDLKIKKTEVLEHFEYEIFEKDFILEVLMVIEDLIYEIGNVEFYFEALNEAWNVTIFGDLSVFLEQLAEIYNLTKGEKNEYILDFHEVGTDRKLLLTKVDHRIQIKNHCLESWKSPIDYEFIDVHILKNEITMFVAKVKNIIAVNCPKLNELSVLKKWFDSFGIA